LIRLIRLGILFVVRGWFWLSLARYLGKTGNHIPNGYFDPPFFVLKMVDQSLGVPVRLRVPLDSKVTNLLVGHHIKVKSVKKRNTSYCGWHIAL
jgi:hypothetical protein